MHVPKRQMKLFLEGIGKKKLLLLATRKHTHTHTLQLARIFCPHACSFFKWHFLHDSLLDRIISYLHGPTASRLDRDAETNQPWNKAKTRCSWQEQLPNRQHHTIIRVQFQEFVGGKCQNLKKKTDRTVTLRAINHAPRNASPPQAASSHGVALWWCSASPPGHGGDVYLKI